MPVSSKRLLTRLLAMKDHEQSPCEILSFPAKTCRPCRPANRSQSEMQSQKMLRVGGFELAQVVLVSAEFHSNQSILWQK